MPHETEAERWEALLSLLEQDTSITKLTISELRATVPGY